MKKKILFFGWEYHEQESIQDEVKKTLGKEFELIFVSYEVNAFDEIAKAKLLQNNPLCAIVFKRNTLVANTHTGKVITKFAEHYQDLKYLVVINLIYSDQDIEARNGSIGAHFAKQGDWKQVAVIIRNNT